MFVKNDGDDDDDGCFIEPFLAANIQLVRVCVYLRLTDKPVSCCDQRQAFITTCQVAPFALPL